MKTNSKLKINPLGGCNDAFSESSSFFSFFSRIVHRNRREKQELGWEGEKHMKK